MVRWRSVVLAVEVNPDLLHLGMLRYIRNGFLHDAEAGRLNRGTRPGQRGIARVVGVQAELRNLALAIPLQRSRQSQLVEHDRAQFQRQGADLLHQIIHQGHARTQIAGYGGLLIGKQV